MAGTQSQQLDGYTLTAPDSVSVQRGLCVHIPCTFTYPGQSLTALYAYWFNSEMIGIPGGLVATNDKKHFIGISISQHFQFTGDPAHGDCSFSINSARSEDQGKYYLRIEGGGSLKFSYRTGFTQPQVVVTELTEKPEIRKSSELILGEPVIITCQAPGICSGTPPQISWTPFIGNIEPWQHPHSNGSVTYGSNITITPSLDNEGRVLTCSVTYLGNRVFERVENTIRVDTAYAPRMIQITATITHKGYNMSSISQQRDPVSVETGEGDEVSLFCEANSRPDPLLSWTKENKTLGDSRHSLLLLKIRIGDAGMYQCQAKNQLGSVAKTVQLIVKYAPKLTKEATCTCWREGNDFLCTCALQSWPPPQIWWQVEGETLGGNSSRGPLSVTSWLTGKKATSTLRLTGSLGGNHSVICFGNNSVGVYTMQFPLSTFRTELHNRILSELFGSETKGIVFLLGLYLIKAVLCFLLFMFAFRVLNRRKSPLRKATLTTGNSRSG